MLVVNREILLVMAMLFFALVDPTAGQIIHVDDDANVGGNGQTWGTAYKYLQDALAAAGSGDQIWVAEGVYKPDQDLAHPTGTGDRTASFQLKSSVAIYGGFPSGGGNWEERDPNAFETMLSGGIGGELWPDNSYHVVVASGTDSSAILDGLTISFGAAYHPGLSWEDSRVHGGGMYVVGGSPTVRNCMLVWNIGSLGGGMFNYGSSPILENCIFRENYALSREHSRDWGGGVFCYDSSATIINCVLRNNSATCGGGLFFFSFTAGKVINCRVVDNLASNRGGGMYNSDNSNTRVINCIFSGNCAQGDNGGGLFNSNQSRPSLTNCTLVANQAPNGYGGGLYDFNHSIATLTNCIVWGNIGSSGTDEAAQIDGWPTRVNYSCVQGWTGALGGVGNIGADPLLAADGVHLCPNSPCINAGDPVPSYAGQTDIDGEPRLMNGRVDIGVDERLGVLVGLVIGGPAEVNELSSVQYAATALFDDGSQNDVTRRATWWVEGEAYVSINEDGVLSLGDADVPGVVTIYAQYTDESVVAEAEATVQIRALPPRVLRVPTEYLTIQAAIDAGGGGDVVIVAPGVYTGEGNRDIDFRGRAITVRSENGPENCIIDCQRLGRGFCFYSGEDTASVLDGLTITNGYTEFFGGGILCSDNSNPRITNCDIIDNRAFFDGGGIAGCESKPAISNCLIACNSARDFGGGLCRLAGPISNCIIAGNKAGPEGGGLCEYDGDITNCIITGNTAGCGGGLSWCNGNITGCTISSNKAEWRAGGLHLCQGIISNCIIWGNIAESNAQSFNCTEPTYSCIQDWPYLQDGNIDDNPLFVAPSSAWLYWDLVPFCHWKFDEGEGDTAYDSAGNNHGHIMGAQWTQGQIGDALRFNGGFIHVLAHDEWPLCFGPYDSLSISAWIKCNKDNSDIINKGFMDGIPYYRGYDLGIYQGKLRFAINDHDNTFASVSGTTAVTDDQWHYVVAVRNATERKLQLYLDGRPDAAPAPDTTTTCLGSGASIIIGERFGGIIDELAMQETAFSIEQIQQFYEVGLSGQRLENEPNYGDYHLLPDSPCIDAGDPNYVPAPNEADLDGNPRAVDGDNDGNTVVDMGAYELVPPVEVAMRFTPQALNPESKGNWVKAHFILPEGYAVEDVDTNCPAKITEPFEPAIESEYMNVFVNDANLVEIEAAFDRGELCFVGTDGNSVELTIVGSFTTGQKFYGTETIKITKNYLKYLADLAYYWLAADCGKPDWCGGVDLDQNSRVDFVDFALFDGCCIEIVAD